MRMGLQVIAGGTNTIWAKGDKCFDINVDGHCLKQAEKFIYLGGTITLKVVFDADVHRTTGLSRGIVQAFNKI